LTHAQQTRPENDRQAGPSVTQAVEADRRVNPGVGASLAHRPGLSEALQALGYPPRRLAALCSASKTMSGAMRCKVSALRVTQAAKRGRSVDGQSLAGDATKQWTSERSAVIGETDQALVEGGIP